MNWNFIQSPFNKFVADFEVILGRFPSLEIDNMNDLVSPNYSILYLSIPIDVSSNTQTDTTTVSGIDSTSEEVSSTEETTGKTTEVTTSTNMSFFNH